MKARMKEFWEGSVAQPWDTLDDYFKRWTAEPEESDDLSAELMEVYA